MSADKIRGGREGQRLDDGWLALLKQVKAARRRQPGEGRRMQGARGGSYCGNHG